MRATLFLFFIMALGIGCQPKPIDPAKSAPKYPIQVQKFDSAFFEMDTISAHKSLQALMIKYPYFTEDFITKILMIKSVGDTQPIKAFYRVTGGEETRRMLNFFCLTLIYGRRVKMSNCRTRQKFPKFLKTQNFCFNAKF